MMFKQTFYYILKYRHGHMHMHMHVVEILQSPQQLNLFAEPTKLKKGEHYEGPASSLTFKSEALNINSQALGPKANRHYNLVCMK